MLSPPTPSTLLSRSSSSASSCPSFGRPLKSAVVDLPHRNGGNESLSVTSSKFPRAKASLSALPRIPITRNGCGVAVVVAARHVIAGKRSPRANHLVLWKTLFRHLLREPPPNLAEGTPLPLLSTLCVASSKVAPSRWRTRRLVPQKPSLSSRSTGTLCPAPAPLNIWSKPTGAGRRGI
jgi:hypothetical protein